MADQLNYVRDKLEAARKVRGSMAKISRSLGIDTRTLRSVIKQTHSPNPGTLDKLQDYFVKADKKASKDAEGDKS